MDFNIKNYAVVDIFGIELWITQSLVGTWIIMAVLIAFAVVVRLSLRKFTVVPKGFQNVVELLVETFENFVRSTAGEELMFLGSWFFTVFAYVALANISGIFFMRPPTADWTVTFAIAFVTFVLIHSMGIKFRKGDHIRGPFEPYLGKVPNIVIFPLNLIGELARPISLSFRLFGNVLAGMILMTLVYELAPVLVRFGIPVALHGFFDLFSGVLQTYIFCVLSLSFINLAAMGTE